MSLTAEASRYLDQLVSVYEVNNPPNHRVWVFDRGKEDPVHNELSEMRIIERMGLKGSGWRLTDLGRDWIREKADSKNRSARSAPISTLEEKQRDRFQLLKTIYEQTNGNIHAYVLADELQEATGLDGDAFGNAESYLTGEGLIVGATLSALSITHSGVVEYEATLSSTKGRGQGSAYFPNDVIQPVINQHFHGDVGAVQMGSNAVAHIQQTSNASAAELLEILSTIEADPTCSAHPEVTTELVVATKSELKAESPDWGRIKSIISPLTKLLTGTAQALLTAYLKSTWGI